MNDRRRSLGWFLVAITAMADCLAQVDAASMRPSLVALQVENLDASIRWYTSFLGFEQKDKKEFPDHGLKLAILGRGDFDIELVENSKTLKKAQVLGGKDVDITGFAKVTFMVPQVDRLFQQLTSKGASFAIKLRDSNTRPDEQFFVVLDNEKNWLQFVGKK